MPDIFTSSEDKTKEEAPKHPVAEHKPSSTQQQEQPKPEAQTAKIHVDDVPHEQADADHTEIKSEELKETAKTTMEKPVDAMAGLPEQLRTKPTRIGLLSHYCPNPIGISFVNQGRNEKIILFLRRHFITNIPWIALTILLLLLPIFAFIFFRVSNITLFTLPIDLLIILLCFYYLVILNYALTKFIEWFYHVGIVTKERMLDLDVNNILHHDLAEASVADIVDVSYSQTGFFQSFFNYGNVPIQTEAIKANFEFEAAPKPATVSDIVTDLRPHHSPQAEGGTNHA